jgi:hypothetical protein
MIESLAEYWIVVSMSLLGLAEAERLSSKTEELSAERFRKESGKGVDGGIVSFADGMGAVLTLLSTWACEL